MRRVRVWKVFALFVLGFSTVAVAQEEASARIEEAARRGMEATLDLQMAAWNAGDLPAFCAHYAEDAVFVSPSGLTRGRDEVLRRYQARYTDRAAMGQLSLHPIEVRLFGDAGAIHGGSMVARWTLRFAVGPSDPPKEPATGLTLLVLRPRRLDAEGMAADWEIVQDASM